MPSLVLTVFMVTAATLLRNTVRLHPLCRELQGDPKCDVNPTIDALDLSIECLNTSSVNIEWKKKRDFQLMQLEYTCYNTTSQDFDSGVLKGPSASIQGFQSFSGFWIDKEASCTFTGCVYISQESCWQMNQENVTCFYKEIYSTPTSSNLISTSSISFSSSMIITLKTTSSINIVIKNSHELHTTELSTSSIAESTPLNPDKSENTVNNRIYLVILLVSVTTAGLIGIISIMLLLMCCNWQQILKRSAANGHFYQQKYEHKTQDFKNSVSVYSFGGSSINASIVTKLDSLVFTSCESTSPKLSPDPQSLTNHNSRIFSNHKAVVENPVKKIPEIYTKHDSENIMFSSSPTPSANSSYCQMSGVAESEAKTNSSTSGSNTSLESAFNTVCVNTVGLVSNTKVDFKAIISNKPAHSSTNHYSHDTSSIMSNGSSANISCESISGTETYPDERKGVHVFEVDFCDVDVNNTEVDITKLHSSKVSGNHSVKPD